MAVPILAAQVQGGSPSWTGRPFITACTHMHTHSHVWTMSTCQLASHTQLRDVGKRWSPWRKPTETWENIQTPHRQWPQPENNFFSHQCDNEMTLNKTLFEYLECVFTENCGDSDSYRTGMKEWVSGKDKQCV